MQAEVVAAVEKISRLSGAFVDGNFLQGRGVVLEKLQERSPQEDEKAAIAFIEDAQETVATLQRRVAPFEVPEDYTFFLGYYGGLAIEGDNCRLSLLGTGPMVEVMYPSIDSDSAFSEPGKYGFLSLGTLEYYYLPRIYRVGFFLDLAGTVEKSAVIGMGPVDRTLGAKDVSSFEIAMDVSEYPDRHQKVADSFVDWLVKIAKTGGKVGYVS